MKTIRDFFIKYMALIVLIIALVSLFAPQSTLWISTSWINYLYNLLGYAAGFGIASVLGLNISQRKAMSMEIGMQNSGLATSLAMTSFPNLAMATVPGAIFSVWHNISGGMLATVFRKWNGK